MVRIVFSTVCNRGIFALILLLAITSAAGAAKRKTLSGQLDLAPFMQAKNLWELHPQAIISKSNGLLKCGTCQSELMYANRGGNEMSMLTATVEECVVRLDGRKLKNFYILFNYAKNEQQLPQIKYAFSQMQEVLSKYCKEEGKADSYSFANGRKIAIRQWQTPIVRIRLYCNVAMPGAYLSMLLERADIPDCEMGKRLAVSCCQSTQIARNGSCRVLAVPMRHQLRGIGACDSATLARQLAYLGSEIEPQMVSQMVGGDEAKQLEAEGKILGFYRKVYHINSSGDARRNALDLLMKYNAVAASHSLPPIKYKETQNAVFYGDNFQNMIAGILNLIPPDDAEKYAKFRRIVAAAIDRNVPISWTVVRGSPKTGKGHSKHRRMIVGYDADRDLIYFSDTWGFKNEVRTMPCRAAFAMTVWMQVISPACIDASEFPE